ncbi:MAG: hypothetical protein JJP05_07980 [cyanobacterium endosymbiont of Rhopalodia gibba]
MDEYTAATNFIIRDRRM